MKRDTSSSSVCISKQQLGSPITAFITSSCSASANVTHIQQQQPRKAVWSVRGYGAMRTVTSNVFKKPMSLWFMSESQSTWGRRRINVHSSACQPSFPSERLQILITAFLYLMEPSCKIGKDDLFRGIKLYNRGTIFSSSQTSSSISELLHPKLPLGQALLQLEGKIIIKWSISIPVHFLTVKNFLWQTNY